MNRIIAFVVILAVIWALPPVRERLAVTAQPVLERLGPAGRAMIRPAQREAAKKQVTSIARVVASRLEEGERPPIGNLESWIRRHIPELSGRDPWDRAYWLDEPRGRRVYVVGSDGPDGLRGTPDDIVQSIPH
jgi:hypothetical protein